MPNGNLVQATDGSFYGTTVAGGDLICTGYPTGCGTVFAITAAGRLTTLHIFDANDGGSPWAGMIQQTSGLLYGTGTGAYDTFGTIFALSVGLRPFVKTQPASGKVGAPVIILGTDLSDASSIEFNGTPAPFSVISSSEIKTAVPLAASTGKVEVLTPRGRFVSNIPFRVLP